MRVAKQTVMALATCVLVVAGGCNRAPEKLTPEAAAAKGDALLQEMSKNLSALQTFSYTGDERREVVSAGGAKTTKQLDARGRHPPAQRRRLHGQGRRGRYRRLVRREAADAGVATPRSGPVARCRPRSTKLWTFCPPSTRPDADGGPALQLPLRRVDDERHGRRLGRRAEDRRSQLRSSRVSAGVVDWELWLSENDRGPASSRSSTRPSRASRRRW